MAGKSVVSAFKRWAYYQNHYPKMGLLTDDILRMYPDVTEALRRLPADQKYARDFRISRAMSLSMQKDELPRSEWTTPENDTPYLQPYIKDVQDEMNEKKWWKTLQ